VTQVKGQMAKVKGEVKGEGARQMAASNLSGKGPGYLSRGLVYLVGA
jgi:hypothetical protein